MKLISSRMTFVSKRVFPLVWFGILATIAFGMLADGLAMRNPSVLLGPAFMAVIGYLVIRTFALDLADTVYDFGDYLLIKRGGVEARVPLENIMNVSASIMMNPSRVTLRLIKPSTLGTHVAFSPTASPSFNPFSKNSIAEDLMERAYAARAKSAA